MKLHAETFEYLLNYYENAGNSLSDVYQVRTLSKGFQKISGVTSPIVNLQPAGSNELSDADFWEQEEVLKAIDAMERAYLKKKASTCFHRMGGRSSDIGRTSTFNL